MQPNPHTVLNLEQLARAIDESTGGACRKAGRPLTALTCWKWCWQGRKGVRLSSWLEAGKRLTTWGDYLDWRQRVDRAWESVRQARLAAVGQPRPGRSRARRAAEARRRLEEMGAR